MTYVEFLRITQGPNVKNLRIEGGVSTPTRQGFYIKLQRGLVPYTIFCGQNENGEFLLEDVS